MYYIENKKIFVFLLFIITSFSIVYSSELDQSTDSSIENDVLGLYEDNNLEALNNPSDIEKITDAFEKGNIRKEIAQNILEAGIDDEDSTLAKQFLSQQYPGSNLDGAEKVKIVRNEDPLTFIETVSVEVTVDGEIIPYHLDESLSAVVIPAKPKTESNEDTNQNLNAASPTDQSHVNLESNEQTISFTNGGIESFDVNQDGNGNTQTTIIMNNPRGGISSSTIQELQGSDEPVEVTIETSNGQNLEEGDVVIGYENSWLDIYLNDRSDISVRINDNTYTSSIQDIYNDIIVNQNLGVSNIDLLNQVGNNNLNNYNQNNPIGNNNINFNDVTANTYSGIKINSVLDEYVVNNELAVSNQDRIIINHNGELIENTNGITADSATMFWNIEDKDSNKVAHNIIKGNFIALKNNQDQITTVYLRPDINDENRAILQNDEAEIYMRSNDDDVIVISYNPIGNITNIKTNQSPTQGRAIKEVYFGKPFSNNRREHYVKGTSWELNFIDTPKIYSGMQGMYELTSYRSVINTTIKSKDSLYRYLPQNYWLKHSEYGEAKQITACFLDCPPNNQNLVYVRQDDVGILSIGKSENAIIDYQGNSREVFDENNILFVREDIDDYASTVSSILSFSIKAQKKMNFLGELITKQKEIYQIENHWGFKKNYTIKMQNQHHI